jgi:hypothetical protein
MNMLNEVNAYLIKKVTPYAAISFDVFPGDSSEELMARNDPSQAADTRYMDGSRIGSFLFSYYAKSLNSETARIQLDAFVVALDFKNLTVIAGGIAIRLEAATTPAFVSRTEKGEVIFVVSLRLEYHTGG